VIITCASAPTLVPLVRFIGGKRDNVPGINGHPYTVVELKASKPLPKGNMKLPELSLQ